jgi:hypothetical protein
MPPTDGPTPARSLPLESRGSAVGDGCSLFRTPLRVGLATLWVEPITYTIRYGTPSRSRTLLAGLNPNSYLVAAEHGAIVATVDSEEAVAFSIGSGGLAALGALSKPSWCGAVEATLPTPLRPIEEWLEVGVRGCSSSWYCSIPLGRLPRLQIGLARHGKQMTYITRIRVTDDEC